MSRKILFSILAVLSSLVCGSLLSSDTFAVSRLGNYSGYSTGGISGLPTSWQYNRDTTVSATGNASSYIANGQFGWNLDWNNGQEYYVSIAVMMSAYSSNASTIGSLNAEPINLQGNLYKTINDTITSQRSCSNANNCRSVLVHSIKLVATGTGSEAVKLNSSNLFNISDFWSQYNGSAVLSWNAYIFEDYNEWAAFQSNVSNKLDAISGNTEDTVDILSDIYSDTSSINRNLQSILDAQEQSNDDANDRYQDEKDTIDTNTSGGIDAVDDIDTTINLPNPLSFFLGSLSVNTCYDISTLASMVHSSTTTYCSWFSSSTRTIMTPFVDVFVFVIISMFIWSWVKKGGL